MTFRASTRPITRAPALRSGPLPAGPARVMGALKSYRHQLRPGAAEVLAFVEWADLHEVRDVGQLEDLVCRRLALPVSWRHLVASYFDPRDRVGPARDDRPDARPPAGPPAFRALTSPPVGVEAL